MSATAGYDKLQALAESDPKAALLLLKQLQEKTVIPHPGQKPIIDDDTRFKVICCGRRWGKTVIAAKKGLEKCNSKPNQMVWWVAPTYKIVKRGYREVLRQLPKGMLSHEPPQDSAFDAGRSVILRFKNGSRMEFYSAERPEGMLGEGVDLAILDEAAIMNNGKSVWDQIISPTLIDREGQGLLISTPRGRNWFYYLWLKGQSDDHKSRNYKSWKMPSSANPFLPIEAIEEMKENLPLLTYQQEVEADFVASAGAVFRISDEQIREELSRPKGHVCVGVDLAKSNDFTVLSAANAETMEPCGYDRFNDVAWGVQKNRIKSFVRSLMRAGAVSVTLIMDSTGVGDPIAEEIEEYGYDVVPINFTKTKQFMVTQLAKDIEDGYVRLYAGEDITEFENYGYTVNEETGKTKYSAPEGQHDDCVSAKMLQHWGIVQEGMPNIVALEMSGPIDKLPDEVSSRRSFEDEDYTDLLDEQFEQDTGIPVEVVLIPDSPAQIMARSEAWSGREF